MNKYVDYINWILRRSPTMPMIRLPDPRPNEPVVTLTIMKWTQTQIAPQHSANSQAFKRKPGRPPTKRLNDPPNGVPTPVPNGAKVSDLCSQTTATSAGNTPGSDSPRSNSPHVSLASSSNAGDIVMLAEASPGKNGSVKSDSSRINGSSMLKTANTTETQPPRQNHYTFSSPSIPASPNSTPLVSASAHSVSELEIEAKKRRISDADLASQPVSKAAKLETDTVGATSIRSISTSSIRNPQHVVTPRIEALVSPSQLS